MNSFDILIGLLCSLHGDEGDDDDDDDVYDDELLLMTLLFHRFCGWCVSGGGPPLL